MERKRAILDVFIDYKGRSLWYNKIYRKVHEKLDKKGVTLGKQAFHDILNESVSYTHLTLPTICSV